MSTTAATKPEAMASTSMTSVRETINARLAALKPNKYIAPVQPCPDPDEGLGFLDDDKRRLYTLLVHVAGECNDLFRSEQQLSEQIMEATGDGENGLEMLENTIRGGLGTLELIGTYRQTQLDLFRLRMLHKLLTREFWTEVRTQFMTDPAKDRFVVYSDWSVGYENEAQSPLRGRLVIFGSNGQGDLPRDFAEALTDFVHGRLIRR